MALLVSEDGQLSLEQICSIVEEQKENAYFVEIFWISISSATTRKNFT